MLTISDSELQRWLGELLWPFLRTLALFSTAPLFSAAVIPVRVKVAIAFVIALVLAPAIRQSAPLVLSWASIMLAVQQVLVGAAIGFAMQLVLAAMACAGDFVGIQMGFGFAGLFDVQSRFNVPLMSDLFGFVGLMLFVMLNGHLMLLGVLMRSFALIPVAPGSGIGVAGWHTLASAGQLLFEMGVWLALPVIAVLVAANLAMAVASRVAPQINLMSVGFSLFMGLGLAATIAIVPSFVPAVQNMIAAGLGIATAVLRGG